MFCTFRNHDRGGSIFQESFNYPDGLIVGAPGSPWVNNYLPTNQANVVSGKLFLTQTEDESIRVDFPSAVSSGALYARFTVTFATLPTANDGNFFAFFRQSGVDNLRARVWASTNGAAPGKFRLGLTTIFYPPKMIAADLSLGTNYTVVTRYDITNTACTMWINPVDETDTSLRADDAAAIGAVAMGHFGFLQTDNFGSRGGMGELTVDNLRIGKTFAEVLPLVKFTSVTNLPDGQIEIAGIGQATTNYTIFARSNLLTTNWLNLGVTTASTNGVWKFTDNGAPAFPMRFYRAVSQ
jgi:hypothetical protein